MRCHCRALFVGTECNRQSMRSAAPRKAQRNISSMRRTIKYVNDMPTAAAQQQVNQSKPSSAAQLTAALQAQLKGRSSSDIWRTDTRTSSVKVMNHFKNDST
jgi:hypothetical protein